MFKEDINMEMLELVNEEVQVMARLDHPSICKYVESFEDDEHLYIVMEYMEEAEELQQIIVKKREQMKADRSKDSEMLFTNEKVSQLMYMIFTALHHIHTNNIVHRDFKAENCLIQSKASQGGVQAG